MEDKREMEMMKLKMKKKKRNGEKKGQFIVARGGKLSFSNSLRSSRKCFSRPPGFRLTITRSGSTQKKTLKPGFQNEYFDFQNLNVDLMRSSSHLSSPDSLPAKTVEMSP